MSTHQYNVSQKSKTQLWTCISLPIWSLENKIPGGSKLYISITWCTSEYLEPFEGANQQEPLHRKTIYFQRKEPQYYSSHHSADLKKSSHALPDIIYFLAINKIIKTSFQLVATTTTKLPWSLALVPVTTTGTKKYVMLKKFGLHPIRTQDLLPRMQSPCHPTYIAHVT